MVLEEKDVAQIAQKVQEQMPDMVKGAMNASPKTLFSEFAADSILVGQIIWVFESGDDSFWGKVKIPKPQKK